MKNFVVLFFLLFSSGVYSQKIDGFYTGVLNNDSANRMVQEYELAIAMYKGKITGYSYVTFIVKDTFYYGIRKVKGEIVGDSIIVEDDKFVSNNFPESPAKGVKRTIKIPLNGQDSLISFSGSWKTNQTKKYYSVPGTIEMTKSKDSTKSPLINHLKELGIVSTDNLMVTAAENKTTTAPPVVAKKDVPANEVASNTSKKKDKKSNGDSKEKKENGDVKKDPNAVAAKEVKSNQQTEVASNNKSKQKTETTKQEGTETAMPVSNSGVIKTSSIQTAAKIETINEPVVPTKLSYKQRATQLTKTVEINSDSLVIAFYDNGVVDGDSISVYLNGESIVSNTKLTTVATKKTIKFDKMDEVKLVLVAENLGTIPPNTGLMTIRDGDNIYQVHFSADMQTNASIILKRKK